MSHAREEAIETTFFHASIVLMHLCSNLISDFLCANRPFYRALSSGPGKIPNKRSDDYYPSDRYADSNAG